MAKHPPQQLSSGYSLLPFAGLHLQEVWGGRSASKQLPAKEEIPKARQHCWDDSAGPTDTGRGRHRFAKHSSEKEAHKELPKTKNIPHRGVVHLEGGVFSPPLVVFIPYIQQFQEQQTVFLGDSNLFNIS